MDVRIPARDEITDDTPLRLDVAAQVSGCSLETLQRAVREGAITHETLAGGIYVTLGYIADMLPVVEAPVPSDGNCIVYVVGFGPYVKIGRTKDNLPKRLSALATGCPEPLKVYGAIDAPASFEADLHRRFAHLRLQGEWFRNEGVLQSWIGRGCPRETYAQFAKWKRGGRDE